MRELSSILVAMLLVIGLYGMTARATPPPGAPPMMPLRAIPGITADDPFPRGCVDCHIDRPDIGKDVRISTAVRQWQEHVDPAFLVRVQAFTPRGIPLAGRHPDADVSLADIPFKCMACHGRDSTTAPPFGRLLHGLHFAGGENNHFLTEFQGECTHCHKLHPETGALVLASSPEP